MKRKTPKQAERQQTRLSWLLLRIVNILLRRLCDMDIYRMIVGAVPCTLFITSLSPCASRGLAGFVMSKVMPVFLLTNLYDLAKTCNNWKAVATAEIAIGLRPSVLV